MQIVMPMYLLICFITYAHKMIRWDFLGENIWVSNIGRCATLGYTAVIWSEVEIITIMSTYSCKTVSWRWRCGWHFWSILRFYGSVLVPPLFVLYRNFATSNIALSLFSGIFWLAFVDIFCWIALNRLKSTRKKHLSGKKEIAYLKYDNNRLEKSRLQHNYRYLTCKKLTIQGGKKTSRPSEDAKVACILTWRFCTNRHVDEGTRSRLVINRFLLSKAYIDYLAFIIKLYI